MIRSLWKFIKGDQQADEVGALAHIIVDKARAADNPREGIIAIERELKEFIEDHPLEKGEPFDNEISFAWETADPVEFEEGEARKQISEGVHAIMRTPVGKEAEVIVAYKFDGDTFTTDTAVKWLGDHYITDFLAEEVDKSDPPPEPDPEPTDPPEAPALEAIATKKELHDFKLEVVGAIKQLVTDSLRPVTERLKALEDQPTGSQHIDDNDDEGTQKQSGAWLPKARGSQ